MDDTTHHGANEHPHGAHQALSAMESVECHKIRQSRWFEVELFSQASTTQRHSQLPVTGQETGVEHVGFWRATHVASVE